MTDKHMDIGSLIAEKNKLLTDIEKHRKEYLEKRAKVIQKMSDEYHNQQRLAKLKVKRLESLIAANSEHILMTVMQGGDKPMVDTTVAGYNVKTEDEFYDWIRENE